MIQSKFRYGQDQIQEIEVSGHAFYAAHGSDIVCSAVSTALIVTANAIELMKLDHTIDLKIAEGYFKLKVIKSNSTVQVLLENLRYSLSDLERQYSKYIKNQREG